MVCNILLVDCIYWKPSFTRWLDISAVTWQCWSSNHVDNKVLWCRHLYTEIDSFKRSKYIDCFTESKSAQSERVTGQLAHNKFTESQFANENLRIGQLAVKILCGLVSSSQTGQFANYATRGICRLYAICFDECVPKPARRGFAMLGRWLPGFGPHWSGSTYLRELLDCWSAVLGSVIEKQLMVLDPGLHKSIAFNSVGCSSCLGLGSSPDRSSS